MAVTAIFLAILIAVISANPMISSKYEFDDSSGLGRKFDGIGGLSGGGATSKLLVNYPEKERNEILDYLFKPNFGASLQILKVEIGGDAQSTDGTEASHMHNSWEENYQRGYEWWLMMEAKKRNPSIKLYGLPWGFPGWLGNGSKSPFQNVELTADYVIRWINGAKVHHNLTIDYVGIWNERMYNIHYIKVLRKMLDQRGYSHVRIVAADKKWEIAEDVLRDSSLASAVDFIGCHYPGTESDADAIKTGKPLWASEDYSTFNNEVGGVAGHGTISWNLIASYYNHLPYYRDGLMTAVEPWSGNYNVDTTIWMSAHTTQFTEIGWTYLRHGSGVGILEGGGSYVALVSPDGKDLTVIVETMSHNHSSCIRPPLPPYDVVPQTMEIQLEGSFGKIPQMNVWYSKLGFGVQPTVTFQVHQPITFDNGMASLSLGLDEVYTLTTLTRGQKGQYPTPPPSKLFPLPYTDDFESYAISEEPYNLAQQTGAYEIVDSDSSHGQVARQMVLQTPVHWCAADLVNKSISMIGDFSWSDIYVEIEARLSTVNQTSGVFVAARVNTGGCHANNAQGLFVFFFVQNQTYIVTYDLAHTKVLTQGIVTSRISDWNKLSLLVQGSSIQGAINGNNIFNTTAPKAAHNGFVAIGTDTYGIADFDNIRITTAADGVQIMRENHKFAQDRMKDVLFFEPEQH